MIVGICVMLTAHTSISQQTSTLELKFRLIDSVGEPILPDNSNYIYVDYWNGDEMPLNANNNQITYDTISEMFVAQITVPRYEEYSFILKNKESKEAMVFRIAMDGNLSEQLTFDEIHFTPGVYVFNLTSDVNFYHRGDLEINKCSDSEESEPCNEIKGIDWDAGHIHRD